MGMFSGNALIAGVLTGQFPSYLGWKRKPWVQLSQCSPLVSRPFQGKKQKPVLSVLFSKLTQGGFWSCCGIKNETETKKNGKCWNFPAKTSSISDPTSLAGIQGAPFYAGKVLSPARRGIPSWKCSGTDQSVFPDHSPIYGTTFCTVEKFWDSGDDAQEPPTCGASFGAEMGFGRLPPFPPPPRPGEICGASPTTPSTCSEPGRGSGAAGTFGTAEVLWRFMVKYSCVLAARLFLLICKCKALFCTRGLRLPAGVAGAVQGAA